MVTKPLDTTTRDGGVMQYGTFTVPADVPHERVAFYMDVYRRKVVEGLEKEGYEVLNMSPWHIVKAGQATTQDPTRRRYRIAAWCTRRPEEVNLDIPDEWVPEMLKRGLRLKD